MKSRMLSPAAGMATALPGLDKNKSVKLQPMFLKEIFYFRHTTASWSDFFLLWRASPA